MGVCKLCSQALTIELDPEDFNEATSSVSGGDPMSLPDDLELSCGCHFHWQCLLDESPRIVTSFTCPSCNESLISNADKDPATNSALLADSPLPQILTRYHNEGGIQEKLDILPLVTEEAYLDATPAARPARAFMTMCGEGDVAGIVELLEAIVEDPDEDGMAIAEILRYQDPLDRMKTGLHIAIEMKQHEAVWMLLWVASSLQPNAFPAEVSSAAERLGAKRDSARSPDIRSLRDAQGRTAGDVAGSMGNTWAGLIEAGFLKIN